MHVKEMSKRIVERRCIPIA
jgi:hypothetical protein